MNLRDKLLETLSFLEPMELERIYLDFDEDFVLEHHELTSEDLERELNDLVKTKKVKKIKEGKTLKWIKVFPKKPLLARLSEFLKGMRKTK